MRSVVFNSNKNETNCASIYIIVIWIYPNQKNCGINRVKNRVKITQFTRDLHTIFSYANELTKSCYKIVKKSENDFLQNQKTIFSKIRK